MVPRCLWGGALCAVALLSTSATAQIQQLTTLFATNNGLGVGSVVFFDITVTNAVRIVQFDVNTGTAGPINSEFYVTPGTYSGNEQNAGAWTLASTGSGTGMGSNNPSPVPLASAILLTPGTYGMAIYGVDHDHDYTNGNGSNQNYSDANLALALGSSQSGLFTGSPIANRVANMTIHYTLANGLFPEFTATPTSGTSPLNVQFTDQTYSSGSIAGYAWDFDNNGTVDSTAQNPSHVYNSGGKYTVKLTVTDSVHGQASLTKTDFIEVNIIEASFTATPTFGTVPLQVQFTDTSTGAPTAWAWDFDNDGVIDSTQQNPTFTYTQGGRYTVSMIATNAVSTDTATQADLITAVGATNNTAGADIVEYHFNEVRYDRVANAASTTLAPSHGTVMLPSGTTNPNWQGDAGRVGFMGNSAGTGCLGADNVTPYESRVDSGWQIDLQGSHTVMFWARFANLGTGFPYVFGSSTGSARCYHAGSYLSLRNWGNLGFVDSASDPDAQVGWHHWALVVDDAAGTAQWYLNGVVDGSALTFTPNTFTFNAGNLIIGGYGTTTTLFTRYFDMDDFRVYGSALTPTQILAAMQGENAAATTFGEACAGANGDPQISASGGSPVLGNNAFAIEGSNLEAGRPGAVNLGLFATGSILPFDLAPYLGVGCTAETLPDLGAFSLPGTTAATLPLPVPNTPALAGAHLYAQILVLGTTGAATEALDIQLN